VGAEARVPVRAALRPSAGGASDTNVAVSGGGDEAARLLSSGSTAFREKAGTGRLALGLVLALGVLALVCLASLAFGARQIPFETLVQALTNFDPANGDHAVVHSRIPRTVTGLLVGAALGVAGTAMQGVARNPLADPGILGVNAGAALAVVTGIYLFGVAELTGYIWFAFAGAALAAAVVYCIASIGREGATPIKLALAGAALTAGLSSLMNGILVSSQDTLDAFRFWQIGSVSGRGWDAIVPVLPFIGAGLLLTLFTGRLLNNFALGDDVARGLGQRVGLSRAITALGVVVLCGAATALAGPIAFVGLVIPHLVRAFTGPDYRWILPYALLLAPVLLLGADIVGRLVALPGEIQAGIMTAVIGAPVFIWIVRRRKAAGL
jgi:iron complex transport system permease protein